MKFKVGDKVVYVYGVEEVRGEYVGKVIEVAEKGNYPYRVKFSWGTSYFAEHELALATTGEIRKDKAK